MCNYVRVCLKKRENLSDVNIAIQVVQMIVSKKEICNI